MDELCCCRCESAVLLKRRLTLTHKIEHFFSIIFTEVDIVVPTKADFFVFFIAMSRHDKVEQKQVTSD